MAWQTFNPQAVEDLNYMQNLSKWKTSVFKVFMFFNQRFTTNNKTTYI